MVISRIIRTAFVAVCVFLAGCALTESARVVKDNPDLRPADGTKTRFKWKRADRDDFVVFYATLLSDPTAGAGIYVGGSPDFKPPRDAETIEGKLGAFDVTWYPLQSNKARFSRTCLIDYQKAILKSGQRTNTYITKRHVWVYANTEETLDTVISEISKLRMFAARPPVLIR